MSYISSNTIKVYPTALRGGVEVGSVTSIIDPESRLSTEANINSAVNRLSIDGSFVISDSISDNTMEFSVKGYYFKLSNVSSLTGSFASESGKTIYANIRITTLSQDSYSLKSLVSWESNSSMNLDVDNQFKGINFSDSDLKDESEGKYSLPILKYIDNAWTIPAASKLRFDADSVMIDATRSAATTSLHDVISKDSNLDININADNITADEFTGHFTGNLAGNATTSTDANYAAKYGTSTSHPAIGSTAQPVFVNSNGEIKPYTDSKGGFNGSNYTSTYVSNGIVQSGQTIYISTSAPSGTANEGDIWYQYI